MAQPAPIKERFGDNGPFQTRNERAISLPARSGRFPNSERKVGNESHLSHGCSCSPVGCVRNSIRAAGFGSSRDSGRSSYTCNSSDPGHSGGSVGWNRSDASHPRNSRRSGHPGYTLGEQHRSDHSTGNGCPNQRKAQEAALERTPESIGGAPALPIPYACCSDTRAGSSSEARRPG